jgi:hypothetical protein
MISRLFPGGEKIRRSAKAKAWPDDVDLFVDETEGYVRQNRAQQFKRWRQLCPFAGRNIHIAAL